MAVRGGGARCVPTASPLTATLPTQSFPGGGTFGGDAQRSVYDPFRLAYHYGVDTPNAAGTATQLTGGGSVAGLSGLHDAVASRREQEAREWMSLRAVDELRASAVVALLSQRACDINNDAKCVGDAAV